MSDRYVYGDVVMPEEARIIRERLASDLKARKRMQRMGMQQFLKALHEYMPQRLEHEVNRLRGYAFDSGEHGFSHTVIN